ncbi:MAG: DUF3108 domain-containing protein [Nitrospinae bacterium]|nr:DUF3108 domain-containing protein [Nitrospinota bacterium]
MVPSENQKHPLPTALIVLFGLFLLGTSNIFALDDPIDSTGKYIGFKPHGDITRFAGETLFYDISFLWFENAATAKVQFIKERGKYYSTLEASTKGFVGFFTAYRKHFYKTEFEIVDDGKSLRPKSFLRQVTIGGNSETTRHKFNYSTRKHTWSKFINDEKFESGEEDIPVDHSFHDILTAFYNVRNSNYGSLTKGNRFKIKTIPEKGHDEISVHIWSQEEEEKFRIVEGREKKDEMLLNIIVPKEIFQTETGELMVWSSTHFIPVETTVKDYILLGDLHAKFTRREISLR